MDILANVEPMFEFAGQWYIIGNRTLNNLNLCGCGITEVGLRILLETIHDQELCTENSTMLEGSLGLFDYL